MPYLTVLEAPRNSFLPDDKELNSYLQFLLEDFSLCMLPYSFRCLGPGSDDISSVHPGICSLPMEQVDHFLKVQNSIQTLDGCASNQALVGEQDNWVFPWKHLRGGVSIPFFS